MLRMSVLGERSEADKAKPVVKNAGAAVLGSLGIGVTVADAVRVAGSRAAADQVVLEPAARGDALEVTLEGGIKLYLPVEQVPELLAAPPGRSTVIPGTIPLASSLARGDGTRGVGDWAIEGLRLIGIDLAGQTAASVARAIDEHQVPKPGLYRWRGPALVPVEERLPAGSEPWLLFLHGTFSNTLGSFGPLAAQTGHWRRLEATYRDRILALDHHTLTQSPIENAEHALARMPEGADLHLVGYSRGGLVGELLCRGRLEGRALPFDAAELGLFDDPGRVEQRASLERLGEALTALRPGIGRYVRVGCPARGTALASDRLDRWLNLVLSALGLGVGAVASPLVGEIYDLVTAFLLAVIKERADAGTIPGLEAMIPGCPLVRLLNRPGVVATGDLAVLQGDIEGAGILGRLKVLATDLFFREDHDLVVNTGAMDGGMARAPGARVFFAQGAEISHFTYFSNAKTAERVVDGLLRADGEDGGFKPIPAEEVATVTATAKRGGEKRPVVFVLPGITGTVLGCTDMGRERRIWVDLPQLAFGGLRRLAIDQPGITVKEPLSLYYGELCRFLGASHEVRPWGYDWRRSILDNAKELATALDAALAGTDHPVRIVAHSMGGLVARSAFLDPKLWQRFQDRAGSRLIQLGTPNGGSWSIPYMLMGRDTLMSYLAMLDITMSRRAQQEVVVRFPGALQMLPHADTPLFDPARWAALAKLDPGDDDWVVPLAEDMAVAARFRDAFAKAPCDPERLLYIAGHAPTMVGIDEDPTAPAGQRIRFRTSMEGDGQVSWSTGIPPGIRAWYTDAAHGDLPRHDPAFPAILDLLETGTTRRLPTTPPTAVRGRGVPPFKVRDTVPMFPDAEELLRAGMGGTRRAARPARYPKIRVTVVHGHLAFARYPVLVGHYSGDTINGAEKQLDEALDGRLTERRQLGLYPGAIGTTTVALDPGVSPSGAIIVGLGDPGDLGQGSLLDTLRRGLLAYAVEDADDRRRAGAKKRKLGVSALLVGSGAGGLQFPDCIEALLGAAAVAQRALGENGFTALEIVELIEGRAIRAWRDVDRAVRAAEFRDLFDLEPAVDTRPGGRRNVAEQDDPSWWQPIQITMDDSGDERVMRFVTVTGRARAEAQLVPGNTGFVERFVAQATRNTGLSAKPPAAGRALFELLWPNRIKDTSREDRNLRLVLDEQTAAFPWELLDDRRPWADPLGGEIGLPPAVRAGLVRQLVQRQFRETVAVPRGPRQALVIGDPRGEPTAGFAPLPGAEEEAREVADRLSAAGYAVSRLIGAEVTPELVVAALFDQAWTVVHIAAHGVVGFQPLGAGDKRRTETGVALGGGLFLGPAILDQMAVPPLLAFINCCHVGKVEPNREAEQRAQRERRPDLAAGLAVQLVRMGVRGVVAAGWEVDDNNGRRFAGRFYDSLLGGQNFGGAILDARSLIYDPGGRDNTWGAYQCYGDPDWRLVEIRAARQEADEPRFASVGEAVAAAEQIREAAQIGLDRDAKRLRRQLDAIDRARKRNLYLEHPHFRVALAEAYGEIGALTKAIRHYEAARTAERALVPLRALEQLANIRARRAQRGLSATPDAAEVAHAADEIRAAIAAIEAVGALAGMSVERLALLGGCHKRLAWIQPCDARKAALDDMMAAYTAADRQAEQSGTPVFYPRLMRFALEAVRHQQTGGRLSAAVRKLLDSAQASAEDAAVRGDLWAELALADARLLRAMADGRIEEDEERALTEAYLKPWRRRGSRMKLDSVIEQLGFLSELLRAGAATSEGRRQALLESLSRIRSQLVRETTR